MKQIDDFCKVHNEPLQQISTLETCQLQDEQGISKEQNCKKKPHKKQHEVCLHFQFGKNENKLVDETKENRQNHSTFSS